MARYEKRSKGTYRLVVEGGRDAAKKRIRYTKTVKARNGKEAENELAKFLTEINAGTYIEPDKMTFSDFITNEWSVKYAKDLAVSTRYVYEAHLRNYILPKIGHLRLCDIKTMHLVTVMHELSLPGNRRGGKIEPLSARTQAYLYDLLFGIFIRAREWKLIAQNPMDGVSRPKVPKKKMNYYNASEAAVVIEALMTESQMWRLLVLGALIGSCRKGEIIALEWPDVNFSTREITIDKSISITLGGVAHVGDPKSETSIRTIKMPEWYMDELAEYRKKWIMDKLLVGSKWKGGNHQYLFHKGYGVPLHNVRPSKWWSTFVKRHGLKQIRFHDLRHSSATILFEAGATMKEIQERLGHAKESITSNVYVHLTKEMKDASADRLEFLAPKKKSGDR